jgi:hypothetical protein
MSKQGNHVKGLSEQLIDYAERRVLDFHQYSPYHMRIMDGGYIVLDVWTTGRYYVLTTDYMEMTQGAVVRERGGEKGWVPTGSLKKLWSFLDALFYGEDMSETS